MICNFFQLCFSSNFQTFSECLSQMIFSPEEMLHVLRIVKLVLVFAEKLQCMVFTFCNFVAIYLDDRTVKFVTKGRRVLFSFKECALCLMACQFSLKEHKAKVTEHSKKKLCAYFLLYKNLKWWLTPLL